MMQNPDLGLCFRLPTQGDERYLLPEALPASEPDYGTWPEDSLLFRFDYDYLPPGMIPRFIVQAHRHLTTKPTRWRTGVVLKVDGCAVLVTGDRERRRIDVKIAGPRHRRRSALSIIRDELRTVHDLNPEAGPRPRVPLPDDPDKSASYDDLLRIEDREGPGFTMYPEGAHRSYTVGELLQGIRSDTDEPNRGSDGRSTTPTLPGPPAPAGLEQPVWAPGDALRFGRLLVATMVVLVALFVACDLAVGAAAAAAITGAVFVAVVLIGGFVLRTTGALGEAGLLELIRQALRRE